MRLRLSLAAVLTASTFLSITPASADPLDATAATAQTALDKAAAARAYVDHADGAAGALHGAPNVSCSQPTLYGAEATPHYDLVVAELRQTDNAVGSAECVSLTGQAFAMDVYLRIEYCAYRTSLTSCQFLPVAETRSGWRYALSGAATASAWLTYVYPDLHLAIGRPRRVYGCVRTTLTGSACVTSDYSGTYGY